MRLPSNRSRFSTNEKLELTLVIEMSIVRVCLGSKIVQLTSFARSDHLCVMLIVKQV